MKEIKKWKKEGIYTKPVSPLTGTWVPWVGRELSGIRLLII